MGRRAIITMILGLGLLGSGNANAAGVTFDPTRVGDARQVIVVTADSWRATEGTLIAYERTALGWQVIQPRVRAQLGSGGMVRGDQRRQGTGTTPTGVYDIVSAFGRKPNPGTRLEYRSVDRDDAWTYNPRVPRTYNIYQDVNRSWKSYGGYVEELWDMGMQYDYVAVLDFNLPRGPITTNTRGVRVTDEPGNFQRGGGIFLHVDNGNKTAGCIAVEKSVMRELLTWLDPQASPAIVIQVD
jgi:L,D-peptidoglycan transpeptidase YkuD (ErfK/YbiS/YcfS/YnhG family)